jgi:hypothetical protein
MGWFLQSLPMLSHAHHFWRSGSHRTSDVSSKGSRLILNVYNISTSMWFSSCVLLHASDPTYLLMTTVRQRQPKTPRTRCKNSIVLSELPRTEANSTRRCCSETTTRMSVCTFFVCMCDDLSNRCVIMAWIDPQRRVQNTLP